MTSPLSISYFGATDIGIVRKNNEDTFIAEPICGNRYILLAAIDGMGGEEGGEIAAEISRSSIIKYIDEFEGGPALDLIKRAVADANNEIFRARNTQPRYKRMGCVVTAGLIDLEDETLSVAHVGDSRLYRYTNNELSKLTHDHSFVGYQEENGYLTEAEAMKHPRRSVINRCVGESLHTAEDDSFIEASVFPLIPGDVFLFCSDGLSDVLTSAQISTCLCQGGSAEEDCRQLIAHANNAGGKDNVTVVELRVNGETCSKDSEFEKRIEDTDSPDNYLAETRIDQQPSKNRNLKVKFVTFGIITVILSMLMGFEIGRRVTLFSVEKSNDVTVNESSKDKNVGKVLNNKTEEDSCELVQPEIR